MYGFFVGLFTILFFAYGWKEKQEALDNPPPLGMLLLSFLFALMWPLVLIVWLLKEIAQFMADAVDRYL